MENPELPGWKFSLLRSRSPVNYRHPWSSAATALERVFGRFAFPAPIRTLVIFQVLVAVLNRLSNGSYLPWLTLDWNKVLSGQVWRVVTFLFIGGGNNLWLIIFYLFIMWIINDGLEQAWGEFRLNLYLFGTWLGLVLAAAFFHPPAPGYESLILYSSLFIAFASLYPNFEFLLFFILPLKVKWLALVNGAMLLSMMLLTHLSGSISVLLGMSAYLVVFVPKLIHALAHRGKTAARRSRFDSAQARPSPGQPFHTCSRCGITDTAEPDLDFRIGDDGEDYCSRCLQLQQSD